MDVPRGLWMAQHSNKVLIAAVIGFCVGGVVSIMISAEEFFVHLGIIGAFLGCILYNLVFIRFTRRRGPDVEYVHRVRLLDKSARQLVTKVLGWTGTLTIYLDGLCTIGYRRERFYEEMLESPAVESSAYSKFLIYVKLAESSEKNQNYDSEREYLRKALEIDPTNVVANYRLGMSLERAGKGAEAISAYQAALEDPFIDHDHLGKFIRSEIKRVHEKGPIKGPPCPGLSRMLY